MTTRDRILGNEVQQPVAQPTARQDAGGSTVADGVRRVAVPEGGLDVKPRTVSVEQASKPDVLKPKEQGASTGVAGEPRRLSYGKGLRNTGGLKQRHVSPDHIQIKIQKFRQRLTAPDSHDINRLRLQNNVYCRLEGCRVNSLDRILKLLHIRLQYRGQNLRLCAPAIFRANLLHRVDLILHPVFQVPLKFRISSVT